MDREVNEVQLAIFIALFALVTVLGFVAARWRRAKTLDDLEEWGLGGRNFGSWITWFLIGGDIYTAYTFVAVPALVFGIGAVGFFAVPYTIVLYPMVLLAAVRMWSVAHSHGYVTPADFVRGRFGSRNLATAVAITGIVATMPYIALQLVGIEAVLKTIGIEGEWPLIIAFAVLAAYTYQSGLRAPALIAFVKDALIYIVVIVAIIAIPIQLGGFDEIFSAAEDKFNDSEAPADGVLLANAQTLGYSTLAFGSALALFLYPHSMTGLLAARSRDTIKRNMAALPVYSLALGFLALLGYMAIAAGVQPIGDDPNTIVPLLFDRQFSDWFSGVAFAAIAIGALVPAAIMSIAAANLFARNLYREYIKPDASKAEEARVSRIASLAVKAGAVAVILALDPQFSIDLQLIGGVDHLADAAAARARPVEARRPPLGAARRLGVRDAKRTDHAVRHAEPEDGQGALRRRPVRAVELRLRDDGDRLHRHHRARREPVHRHHRLAAAAQVAALEDATRAQDYEAERGDPGVSELPATPAEESEVTLQPRS